MNSIYDAENLKPGFVPVVYGYYDRANMMESTPEVINHSHSLCEIMYVNEGAMSIETERNDTNVYPWKTYQAQYHRQAYALLRYHTGTGGFGIRTAAVYWRT